MIHWSPIAFEKDENSNGYKLLNDVKVTFEEDGFELSFEIPSGYITNGADIPRVVWTIFPPFNPKYIEAVVIHDWLCDVAYSNNCDKETFKLADDAFYEALKIKTPLVAKIFYTAVRMHHKMRY